MRRSLVSILTFLTLTLLATGCVFDGGDLDSFKCDDDEEGAVDELGRRCESGLWVTQGRPTTTRPDMGMVDMAPIDPCERCAPGELCCGEAGAEVCVPSDDDNCGQCGVTCADSTTCAGGSCVCELGLSNCDGDSAVCETDLLLDPANCGQCGRTCDEGYSCVDGECLCGDALCSANQTCCGQPGDQSCVDTSNRIDNCGGCGAEFECKDTELCVSSTCMCGDGPGCLDGQQCCKGECVDASLPCVCGADECDEATELCCNEVCVPNDVENCGACMRACLPGQACEAASCVCPAGTSICDDVCVDTLVDTANCGACGNACAPGAACCSGSCRGPEVLGCTWWNDAWQHRRQITLYAPVEIPAGYPVRLQFDHTAFTTTGKARTDGHDMRVVHYDAATETWTQVARVVSPHTNWNRSDFSMWFRLEDTLPAASTTTNYYLHYGNAAAANPGYTDTDVFIAADNLNDSQLAPGFSVRTYGGATSSFAAGSLSFEMNPSGPPAQAAFLWHDDGLPNDLRFAVSVVGRPGVSAEPVTPVHFLGIVDSTDIAGPSTATAFWNAARLLGTFWWQSDLTFLYLTPTAGFEYDYGLGTWTQVPSEGIGIGLPAPNDSLVEWMLFSNGTSWRMETRQLDGTALNATSETVPWSAVDPFVLDPHLFIGEPRSDAFTASFDIGSVLVRRYAGGDATSNIASEVDRP